VAARFPASEPCSEQASACDIKFCQLAMECQKRKMVLGTGNFSEYHPCRLALFTLKYTPHKSGTVLSRCIYLVKTEKMPPNFSSISFFCSNVLPSAHAGKK
jgi:hypothetical protein